MTEKDIQQIIGKDRVIAGHVLVCPNVNHLFRGQQDMISVRNGYVIDYEIKISRSDYARDRKKNKDNCVPLVSPNYFYYVVPEGLIKVEEVPEYAGLFYIINDTLKLIKKAPLRHTFKHDLNKIFKKVTTLYQQRQFLGCCLLTYNNRPIIARNKAMLNFNKNG